MGILESKLQLAQWQVKYGCNRECDLETDITRFDADGTLEPQLVHTGNNQAAGEDERGDGGCAPGQTPWDIPYGVIV